MNKYNRSKLMIFLNSIPSLFDKTELLCYWCIAICTCAYCLVICSRLFDLSLGPKLSISLQIIKSLSIIMLQICVLRLVLLKSKKRKIEFTGKLSHHLMEVIGRSNGVIREVNIYGYTGKTYLQQFQKLHEQHAFKSIRCMKLLLCRCSEIRAWRSHDKEIIREYLNSMKNTVSELRQWHKEGWLKKYEIKFCDERMLSHFCIINGCYLIGGAIPLSAENKPEEDDVIEFVVGPEDQDLIDTYIRSFDSWYNLGFIDSGLKETISDCPACTSIITTAQINARDSASPKGHLDHRTYRNIPLIADQMQGLDFYILPDSRPISEFHVILMCKFHQLNLFDYLKHIKTMDLTDGTERSIYRLVEMIQAAVKEVYHRDIIIFEHGGMNGGGAASIDHLHLHVILKPKSLSTSKGVEGLLQDDTVAANEEGKTPVLQNYVVDNRISLVKTNYNTLGEFASDFNIGPNDYFLIWDPNSSSGANHSGITVYFMNDFYRNIDVKALCKAGPRQYLRRIFYEALSVDEKKNLYPPSILANTYDCSVEDSSKLDDLLRDVWINNDTVIERNELENERKNYESIRKILTKLMNREVSIASHLHN